MKPIRTYRIVALVLALVVCLGSLSAAQAFGPQRGRQWVTGDFHTHTFLTDGSHTEADVVQHAFEAYGLDWMANSEHGGASARDPFGYNLATPVWRWESLVRMSYPIVSWLRLQYPRNLLVQGLEWNVPKHEHASVGIIGAEPKPISDFEYVFDASDKDVSRAGEGLTKQNATHADAVAGAKFLQDNYRTTSYFLLNHPSRKLLYSAADIRDFNSVAPDVAFGMEGFPGHQKEPARGGYGNSYGENTYRARTYGGADYMTAKVGGLWDSLLGEGRHFWVFVNSDFHSSAADADFWPGEYARSYTFVAGRDYQSVVDGLRSGNSFAVQGDLIKALDFSVRSGRDSATMGETLVAKSGAAVLVTIRFKSPAQNNNGDPVKVDHIDLIAGDVTGIAQPGTPAYAKDTNDSARVVARFTSNDWRCDDGWCAVTYRLGKVDRAQYFRLRGANLGLNVLNETDADGNPLNDDLVGPNDAAKAYADLWFYSNPVFVAAR